MVEAETPGADTTANVAAAVETSNQTSTADNAKEGRPQKQQKQRKDQRAEDADDVAGEATTPAEKGGEPTPGSVKEQRDQSSR